MISDLYMKHAFYLFDFNDDTMSFSREEQNNELGDDDDQGKIPIRIL